MTNAAAGLPPPFHAGSRGSFRTRPLPDVRADRVQARLLPGARARRREADLGGQGDPGHRGVRARRRTAGRSSPARSGILHVRGPHLMPGYWRAPELTAHMLEGRAVPGRADALHARPLHGRRRRRPLLRRPQRRHHQDPRREGELGRGRERAPRDRRRQRRPPSSACPTTSSARRFAPTSCSRRARR